MGILETLIYNLGVSINHHYYAHTVKGPGPTGWGEPDYCSLQTQTERGPHPICCDLYLALLSL